MNLVSLVARALLIFVKLVGFVTGKLLILVKFIGFVVSSCHEPRWLLSCLLTKIMDIVARYSRETIASARPSFLKGVVGSAKAAALSSEIIWQRKVEELRDSRE